MNSHNAQRASSFWDENVKLHEKLDVAVSWLDAPIIVDHCLKKLPAGEKVISVVQWLLWVKEHLTPSKTLDYGLSLGCGDGTIERQALILNICSRFDAYDISPKSIELAKSQSEEKGLTSRINYQVADMNNIQLEENKYDIIFSGMAMHHLYNLEHIFAELKKSLKPNGRFVVVEFVGPTQFQWTDQQLNIINEILEILPQRLKVDARSGIVKERCFRPTIESMNQVDPSEAIRSSDIIPLVYKMWDVEERIDFGGTILHMLLDGIIANFDPAREEDITILKLLEYMETRLIKEGVLPSDFTIIVAKRGLSKTDNDSVWDAGQLVSRRKDSTEGTGLLAKLAASLKQDGCRVTSRKVVGYVKRRFL